MCSCFSELSVYAGGIVRYLKPLDKLLDGRIVRNMSMRLLPAFFQRGKECLILIRQHWGQGDVVRL